jgi:hypothetical protein
MDETPPHERLDAPTRLAVLLIYAVTGTSLATSQPTMLRGNDIR